VRSAHIRVGVIVLVAIFAFTAIAAAPILALIDAQTPIDALFCTPAAAQVPSPTDAALPAAPVIGIRSPRAPPLA
jgi:hypothetical protein